MSCKPSWFEGAESIGGYRRRFDARGHINAVKSAIVQTGAFNMNSADLRKYKIWWTWCAIESVEEGSPAEGVPPEPSDYREGQWRGAKRSD